MDIFQNTKFQISKTQRGNFKQKKKKLDNIHLIRLTQIAEASYKLTERKDLF